MSLAIKVEELSKAYRLGQLNTGALSQDLERWWALLRGKEDPFLKIGEVNDRTAEGSSKIVWSLKDINLEIGQGSAIGIIGKNGAGKSTLLKILSRVTSATHGNIKIKGRVASLLEVGTGFHKELTGRENIFLNGAILGMRKAEIKKHFDEIVSFAGVERYIDTPVKRYSSGMYVRLAFAVAAHLESEILIVDEVLAVGDAEFQKKCLGKMGDISSEEGRTILFVSHNMTSISTFCQKGLFLSNGNLAYEGSIPDVIDRYINSNRIEGQDNTLKTKYGTVLFDLLTPNGKSDAVLLDSKLTFRIKFNFNQKVKNANIGIGINDHFGSRLVTYHTSYELNEVITIEGNETVVCEINNVILRPGTYNVEISLFDEFQNTFYNNNRVSKLHVEESDFYSTGKLPNINQGCFLQKAQWSFI